MLLGPEVFMDLISTKYIYIYTYDSVSGSLSVLHVCHALTLILHAKADWVSGPAKARVTPLAKVIARAIRREENIVFPVSL